MSALDTLFIKENDESLVVVSQKAFSFLKLRITSTTFRELLLSHPSYPSLSAFSDMLTQLQIDYKAVKSNEQQLFRMKGPLFAHLPKYGLVFVSSITDQSIRYFTASTGWAMESHQDFCKKWNGIVFLINTENSIIDERYAIKTIADKLKSTRLPGAVALIAFLLILFVTKEGISILSFLLLTKIAGFVICSILAYFEVSQASASSKFCKIGTKINCQDVLSSPAAKIFGIISMADIGLVYYTSGLAVILFYSFISSITTFLSLFTVIVLLALPYTLFSVYYQSFVLHKWCTLCLTIIFLFWLEATALFIYTYSFDLRMIQVADVTAFAFSSISITLVWSSLKEFLIERKVLRSFKYQLYRLRRKEEVFNALQKQRTKVNSEFKANHIAIGQLDAKNKLLVIINPLCPACSSKYSEAVSLIRNNSNKFNAKFLFHVSSLNIDNLDTKVSATLIELFYRLEEEDFINAVSEWFRHRDFKKLQSKYQISYSDRALRTLQKQSVWLKEMKIRVAPALFYNERKLLDYYSTKELGLLV